MNDWHGVFESVARYFSVLGEPTRLRILYSLCQEERCVSDILKSTGLAQANASRHLGLMYQAGMLSRRRDANQIFYKVADPVVSELCRSLAVQVNQRINHADVVPLDMRIEAQNTPDHRQLFAEVPLTHPLNQKEKPSV